MSPCPSARASLLERLRRTEEYIARERYRGYDPYDALSSPLFGLPVLRSHPWLRFAAQQTLKRLPVNVRPLLGIRKGYNPVTLGLVAQAHAYLHSADAARADYHRSRAAWCVAELHRLRSSGYSGDCWGYDFDWQARRIAIPARTPTIVATGFVTNALFVVWELLGIEKARAMCESACQFVLNDVHRITDHDGAFCWSYSTLDKAAVLNATMKGARLCAQVYSITRDPILSGTAAETVKFVARHQAPSGSWPYSVGDARRWSDNHHTGYVLDCLDEYEKKTGDAAFAEVKLRGWNYYRENFFAAGYIPKYYDDRLHPVDATACAQAILTLCRFGQVSRAERCALWALDRLQNEDGRISYQVHRRYTNRTPYMRWSAAWMFCALAMLVQSSNRAVEEL